MRYGLYQPGAIAEQEQYPIFHPLPEVSLLLYLFICIYLFQNDQAKNSTIDTVNYLFNFLFQEMKDTFKVRQYIMQKLKVEFNDIKKTKLGKMCIQNISVCI